jgi:hypothetical protein
MSERQIILTGLNAASPQEALEWGKQVGVNEGAAMERARLREKVGAMRTAARDRRKNEVLSQTLWDHEGGRIDLADEVLALLAEPGEERT